VGLVSNSEKGWLAWLKRWFGFRKHTIPGAEVSPGTRTTSATGALTPEQVRAVELARQIGGGDCEHAAEVLRRTLPGGAKRRFAGDRLLHEVYDRQGVVYDVTARQYVRPDVWTEEELAEAGLTDAVESGVFTSEQHRLFMDKLNRLFGGVED
jgi:hypothetical protein